MRIGMQQDSMNQILPTNSLERTDSSHSFLNCPLLALIQNSQERILYIFLLLKYYQKKI